LGYGDDFFGLLALAGVGLVVMRVLGIVAVVIITVLPVCLNALSLVMPGFATRMIPSTRDASAAASVTVSTGGVSITVISYSWDRRSRNWDIFWEVSSSAGLGGSFPEVITSRPGTSVVWITPRGRVTSGRIIRNSSLKPTMFASPNL